MKKTQRIGEQLISAGLLTECQLKQAFTVQREMGGSLGEVLVKLGFVASEDLLKALGGTQEEIDQAAALYGVFFQKHEGTEATGYLVDHTASLMVIDEEGHLKLIYPLGTPASDIADDLAYLLR